MLLTTLLIISVYHGFIDNKGATRNRLILQADLHWRLTKLQ